MENNIKKVPESGMDLLNEIYRVPGLNTNGRIIYREAVRGVIFRGEKLLMIHATQNGTIKFPGGGVLAGETHGQALAHEVREECGMELDSLGMALGKVIEYAPAHEPDFDIFKMTSFYYFCEVRPAVFPQALDNYELEMGFEPTWISLDEAINRNKAAAGSDPTGNLFWNKREIFILDLLCNLQNYG